VTQLRKHGKILTLAASSLIRVGGARLSFEVIDISLDEISVTK
jgi:hypothetical protein